MPIPAVNTDGGAQRPSEPVDPRLLCPGFDHSPGQHRQLVPLVPTALPPERVTVALMSAIAREALRLGMHHGAVASDRAITAMLDTVYRDIGVRNGDDYLASHAPPEGIIETGASQCQPLPPLAPKMIGNTRLDTDRPPRPRPR